MNTGNQITARPPLTKATKIYVAISLVFAALIPLSLVILLFLTLGSAREGKDLCEPIPREAGAPVQGQDQSCDIQWDRVLGFYWRYLAILGGLILMPLPFYLIVHRLQKHEAEFRQMNPPGAR